MADESSTMRQASPDGESDIHRLRDIVVEEVSLVDRAANKRRFLVVKRSNQMADNGKPKGRSTSVGDAAGEGSRAGGKKPKPTQEADVDKAKSRVTRAASEEEDEEDETETEKTRRSAESEEKDEDDETDASKAADDGEEDDDEEDDDEEDDDEQEAEDKPAGVKSGDARTRSKADARPSGDARSGAGKGRGGRSAQKAEDDDLVLPAAVKNAVLRVLAQALERLMSVANQVKEAEAPDDETDAKVPDDVTSELEDIGELLEDVAEQLAGPAEKATGKKQDAAKARAAKASVTKAGRRMAKDRLERFQKALEALSAILQELVAAREPPATGGGAMSKRDAVPGMGELAASVNELVRVVKRQENDIVRLRKTPGTSNAIPVEGGGRRGEAQEVAWPLDMNRPISRDTVSKSVSFYDD